MGGVTTMLPYFRTGQYYLNRGGSWRDFFPDVLKLSEDRYWCDYAYHLAPIEILHLEEMEMLAVEHGVPSFKIFMFYGRSRHRVSIPRVVGSRVRSVQTHGRHGLGYFQF